MEDPKAMPTIATSRLVRRSLSAALLLAASGAGCGDVESGMMQDPDPMDTEAPVVASSMPAADATGIAADEKVFVTFSEQMDPATIESAYNSMQLPLDKVSLSWSPDGKVLTISPDQPLEYSAGTGTDPSAVTPFTFTITIGTEAADLAGNTLAEPLELSFSTKRRLTATFEADLNFTKTLRDDMVQSGVSLFVGDSSTGQRYRGYVTFDLKTLPAASEVESASFKGTQQAPTGMPYALGAVMVQHVSFATLENLNANLAISLPGEFSTDGNLEEKVLDVTPQVQDDVTNRATRGDRSQYRFQIDTATDGDNVADVAEFTKNTFEVTVQYVVD